MNSKKLTADLHRSGRNQNPVGIPVDDASQPAENTFRAGLGAKREAMVKRRDEGAPALAVEELAESDLRAIHDLVVSSDAGLGPPRRSSVGSPCQGLNRQSEVTSRRIIDLPSASVNSRSARVLPRPDCC